MNVPQGKQTVSDAEIVDTMEEHPDPAFITKELAEMFGMSTEGVRGRLAKLESEGAVHKKKPTKRTVIWWVQSGD